MIHVINQRDLNKKFIIKKDVGGLKKVFLITSETPLGIPTYIGRSTPLGNPYTLRKYGLEESINLYHQWLRKQYKAKNAVYQDLMQLVNLSKRQSLVLVCHCKPAPCHGDIVKLAIENILRKEGRL